MNKIAVHLAEGFEEIEAISIIDVLRRAAFEVEVVSMTQRIEVAGAHHITVKADTLFEDLNYEWIDMIILPGGMPGTNNLNQHEELKQQILNFHENGKPLGAICAAPLVFGKLGILKDKQAPCCPGFEEELKGAKVSGKYVEQTNMYI